MKSLVPEKRVDKNGRLVTKHVRVDTDTPADKTSIPVPSLSPTKSQKSVTKPFKPRPKQLVVEHQSHSMKNLSISKELVPESTMRAMCHTNHYLSFEASEVEIYDVFSAVKNCNDGIYLLSKGVRTAEQARSFLNGEVVFAPRLVADKSDMMQEALQRNIYHYGFVQGFNTLTSDEVDMPHVLDAIELASDPANEALFETGIHAVAAGEISYQHLKEVGLSKLARKGRLDSMILLLKDLKSGKGNHTVGDLKLLVSLSAKEKINSSDFYYLCDAMRETGIPIDASDSLKKITYAYDKYLRMPIPFTEKYERLAYAIGIYRATDATEHDGAVDSFFKAGIPSDLAIRVINEGGSAREAQGIQQDDINSAVAKGWL